MFCMRVDHVSYAAEAGGLQATAARLSELIGVAPVDGGVHPRFGTRNVIFPLAKDHYVEVVEVLDHPASDKAPFGQAVRAASEAGGGWLGWVVAVDDLGPIEQRIGRPPVDGHRHLPDGTTLEWQQLGVKDLQVDPQLPFFVRWLSDPATHPSANGHQIELLKIVLAGDRRRINDWLGGRFESVLRDVDVDWTQPNGRPGLVAAVFSTPRGEVTL